MLALDTNPAAQTALAQYAERWKRAEAVYSQAMRYVAKLHHPRQAEYHDRHVAIENNWYRSLQVVLNTTDSIQLDAGLAGLEEAISQDVTLCEEIMTAVTEAQALGQSRPPPAKQNQQKPPIAKPHMALGIGVIGLLVAAALAWLILGGTR